MNTPSGDKRKGVVSNVYNPMLYSNVFFFLINSLVKLKSDKAEKNEKSHLKVMDVLIQHVQLNWNTLASLLQKYYGLSKRLCFPTSVIARVKFRNIFICFGIMKMKEKRGYSWLLTPVACLSSM